MKGYFLFIGIWLLGKTGFASFTLAVIFIGNCRVAVLKNWLVCGKLDCWIILIPCILGGLIVTYVLAKERIYA
jgi:hypothetical protein